jgi:tyrosine-protein kinase Etk/Wzc
MQAAFYLLLVTFFGQNAIKKIDYARQRFEQNGIDVKSVIFNCVVKKARNAYGNYVISAMNINRISK